MFTELLNSVCCCSCGLCCSNDSLCDNCITNTLKANGLPIHLAPELKGLSQRSYNHGNRFDYSELYTKLKSLRYIYH